MGLGLTASRFVQLEREFVAVNRFQDLSLYRNAPGARGRSAFIVLLWQFVRGTLFAWSPQPAYAWRRWLLRVFGAEIGHEVIIRPSARVTYPWKVAIGDYSWVGDDVEIYSLGPIRIGSHTVVSQRSFLCGGGHDYGDLAFPVIQDAVTVGDEVWVATDCYIAPGVTIGHGAIVAARSTVLSDVPAATIVAGTPAVAKSVRQPSVLRSGGPA